ncbi:hypothetical protein LUZ63_009938 [Rhynchospora breviuscula]|uniref:CW-type domain-containing protein n=1 Tax=Rhynchospora breviuscula TaxID=2022672 RepID=A0A9Q0HPL3_9POAL|nr:hypothetical protein LUZ63_009938 [Rhynchospora breviuscula]
MTRTLILKESRVEERKVTQILLPSKSGCTNSRVNLLQITLSLTSSSLHFHYSLTDLERVNPSVALVSLAGYELYIRAADSSLKHAVVMYRLMSPHFIPKSPMRIPELAPNLNVPTPPAYEKIVTGIFEGTDDNADYFRKGVTSPPLSSGEATNVPEVPCVKKNLSSTHPTYLKTLSQTHAGWIFGAIAELVDNSRDAKSKRLDINIESFYSKKEGKKIHVLSIVDDGHGMSHDEIMTMVAFGHDLPECQQPDRIGRFGIGFKSGSMRLGKDAIVLTQTTTSRSVALLSQSFNEDKSNLEIPVVSYCKHDNYMEFDLSIQSEASAEYNLKAIKGFSPFNEYVLGEKLGLFGQAGTGTQIYIWNLDKWGQNYSLEWDNKEHEGDILIRSKRVRTRLGQICKQVPLDYSLRAYMEVIFLTPRMRIYIQGSLVKARPLAKSLNKTEVLSDMIMGKPLQLTLGRSKIEWERFNSGIFLYWHGRLIEAYKRVGSHINNSMVEVGRGVIGVIDVTNLMDDDDGNPWVLNSKQGFQDCETYANLEEWLGKMYDEYWDRNFDTLDLKKGSDRYKPDDQWVQCNKCRKWRVLDPDFDTDTLPVDWFCFMPPYRGSCEDDEKPVGRGVITVSAKRSGYRRENITTEDHGPSPAGPSKRGQRVSAPISKRHSSGSDSSPVTGTSSGARSISTEDEDFVGTSENIEEPTRTLKRLRRGLPRGGKY